MTKKIPYVHCPTLKDFNRLMEAYKKKGWRRSLEGEKKRYHFWNDTCVVLQNPFRYDSLQRFKRNEGKKKYGPRLTVDKAIARLEEKIR